MVWCKFRSESHFRRPESQSLQKVAGMGNDLIHRGQGCVPYLTFEGRAAPPRSGIRFYRAPLHFKVVGLRQGCCARRNAIGSPDLRSGVVKNAPRGIRGENEALIWRGDVGILWSSIPSNSTNLPIRTPSHCQGRMVWSDVHIDDCESTLNGPLLYQMRFCFVFFMLLIFISSAITEDTLFINGKRHSGEGGKTVAYNSLRPD